MLRWGFCALSFALAIIASTGCSSAGRPTTSTGQGGGVSSTTGSSVSSTSTTAGQGGSSGCSAPGDCPVPANRCERRTCVDNACGTEPVESDQPVDLQTAGNCHRELCDGMNGVKEIVDDTDAPNDGKACTTDSCSQGMLVFTPIMMGTTCGTGLECDMTGNCAGCIQASDCAGSDSDCQHRTCSGGACLTVLTPLGTATSDQSSGDCKKNVCNGIGTSIASNDDADVPVDDIECTHDFCTAGAPSNPPLAAGAMCGQGKGTHCNGSGLCVQCDTASDCGAPTDCKSFTCDGGTCTQHGTTAGTVTTAQTLADCKQAQCNGTGGVVDVAFPSDVPFDNNDCTDDVCTGAIASNPPAALGKACSIGFCNATGGCVQCNTVADCGAPTECRSWTCTIANACVPNDMPLGTVLTAQTTGDCRENHCNGMGGITSDHLDTDLPVDGKQCTSDLCTNGAPSNPLLAFNTVCNQGLGHFCDDVGDCLECNQDSQCTDHVCSLGICLPDDCGDAEKNGLETDVDCGGGACPACPNGFGCLVGADCTSGYCGAGFCSAPPIPSVLETSPHNSDANIDPLSNISITFDTQMNLSTLTVKSALDSGACTGSIQVSTDDFVTCIALGAPTLSMGTIATMSVAPALSYGSTYRVRVTTAAQSIFGTSLAAQYDQLNGFTTKIDGVTVLNETGSPTEVDACNLQSPSTLTLAALASSGNVYCRFFETGVTSSAGAAAGFSVELGVGPRTANPEDQTGFTWSAMTYDTDVGGSDQYVGSFTAPAVGSYSYACRIVVQSNMYTYCDLNGAGRTAGLDFETTELPLLSVTP